MQDEIRNKGKEAKIVRFGENEVILKEGEINTSMFKILKGHAEIYVGYGTEHESIIGIIGEQSCFGELGLLLKIPSIYTVIAYSDLIVMRISEGEMGDFIAENHKTIMDIMRNMAKSMVTMRKQIDLLLGELQDGKKLTEIDMTEKRREAKRFMRAYAMYNSSFIT